MPFPTSDCVPLNLKPAALHETSKDSRETPKRGDLAALLAGKPIPVLLAARGLRGRQFCRATRRGTPVHAAKHGLCFRSQVVRALLKISSSFQV